MKHRARMCGKNIEFGCRVWGEEQGTSRCYRVFSAAGSVLASSQIAVSQTELWLCFLQVKADKHCLWHSPHSNQRNGTWSRWVTGCARLQESYLLLMSLQKCHYRDRVRWGYSCCCRTSVLLAFCRAGCQGNSQMSVQCLML